MEWKEIAGTISSFAPSIGALVGGPVGAGVGTGIKLLAKAFGLNEDATPDQINQIITTDPEAALKLKMAEMSYQLELNKQELEETKTYLEDIQNSRSREIEFVRTTGKRDYLQAVLAIFGWLAPVGLIVFLLVFGLPTEISADAAALIGGFIGIIISEYKTIYQYFFGSSKGSEQKTNYIIGENERKNKKL